MNCPTQRNEDAEILLDYCARKLSPLQTAELEAHLKTCTGCARLVEAQKQVWDALEAWSPATVSDRFDAALYAKIAAEEDAPSWQLWLRRMFQPPVPYTLWKSVVPLAAACAVLAAGLLIRMPDAPTKPVHPQMNAAGKVDIEQVEQALEDFDLLTPQVQKPAGSM